MSGNWSDQILYKAQYYMGNQQLKDSMQKIPNSTDFQNHQNQHQTNKDSSIDANSIQPTQNNTKAIKNNQWESSNTSNRGVVLFKILIALSIIFLISMVIVADRKYQQRENRALPQQIPQKKDKIQTQAVSVNKIQSGNKIVEEKSTKNNIQISQPSKILQNKTAQIKKQPVPPMDTAGQKPKLKQPWLEKELLYTRLANNTNLTEFDKYFASKATIIQSTVALKNRSQYKPVIWPEFGNNLPAVDIDVALTTSGRSQMLASTLYTFFKFNSYPIRKFVVIHDGMPNDNLNKIIKDYPNITWVITNLRIGQVTAVDQAYQFVGTEYYFHSEDDWEYLRPGFIEYCLQALEYDPKISGLHINLNLTYSTEQFDKGPLQITTEFQLPRYSGFSFFPSLHRMKDYKMLGGYTNATFNFSYGKGVGDCEEIISARYVMAGFHYAKSRYDFIYHTGAGKGSPVKSWGAWGSTQGRQFNSEFMKWTSNHNDPKKESEALDYLIPKDPQLLKQIQLAKKKQKNEQQQARIKKLSQQKSNRP